MRPHNPRRIAAEIQGGAVVQSAAETRPMHPSSAVREMRPVSATSTLRKICCISAREMPSGKEEATSSHCSAVRSRSPGLMKSATASAIESPDASNRRRKRAKTRAKPSGESDTRGTCPFTPRRSIEVHVKNVMALMSPMVRVPARSTIGAGELGTGAAPGRGAIPGGRLGGDRLCAGDAAAGGGMPIGSIGSGAMPGGAAGRGGPGVAAAGCGAGRAGMVTAKTCTNSA
mmetsp:Transcript_124597/g.240446  ORF Transcript_124597/g.240446 Transcript_124597/m.240446 type:complete len:230 (+) Transcript_124597:984-1673(+)